MIVSRHHAAGAAAAVLALALLYTFDPATTAVFPSCPFRALTGLLCPGCGTLRAIHALLHGEVGAAFGHNPLALMAAGALGAAAAIDRLTGRASLAHMTAPRASVAAAWIAAAFGVARNLVP